MAGTYEPKKESFIDPIPEEKKTVNIIATVPKISNQLLNLFFQSQPEVDTLPKKEKRKKYQVLRDTLLILKCIPIIGPYVFLPSIKSRSSTNLEMSSTMTMRDHTS